MLSPTVNLLSCRSFEKIINETQCMLCGSVNMRTAPLQMAHKANSHIYCLNSRFKHEKKETGSGKRNCCQSS